jgi:hypothetical protein
VKETVGVPVIVTVQWLPSAAAAIHPNRRRPGTTTVWLVTPRRRRDLNPRSREGLLFSRPTQRRSTQFSWVHRSLVGPLYPLRVHARQAVGETANETAAEVQSALRSDLHHGPRVNETTYETGSSSLESYPPRSASTFARTCASISQIDVRPVPTPESLSANERGTPGAVSSLHSSRIFDSSGSLLQLIRRRSDQLGVIR